ncbi:MAG: hypothetical protein Harvfovirus6_36 [Harvfovirus sp.]|uniref:Uncharacterized protein n=1 Tax=Harvfovirus sp. TaxID=2487768 RepID=A0A3G5A0N2_9VIRU|nr:MAG: hypothetical protein Harvfovirus6_36 [Harvfovirus sp.]
MPKNINDLSSAALIIKMQIDNCLTIVETDGIAVSEFKNGIYLAYNEGADFPITSLTIYREINECLPPCPCDKIIIKNLSTMPIFLIDVLGFDDHPDMVLPGGQVVIKNETGDKKCKPITVLSINRTPSSTGGDFEYVMPTVIPPGEVIFDPRMWSESELAVAGEIGPLPLGEPPETLDVRLKIIISDLDMIIGRVFLPSLPTTPKTYEVNERPVTFIRGGGPILVTVSALFTVIPIIGGFRYTCNSMVIATT